MIAVFMGEDISQIIPNRFDSSMPYHRDWNWLMPVVEKIEKVRLDGDEFHVQIGYAQKGHGWHGTNATVVSKWFDWNQETPVWYDILL